MRELTKITLGGAEKLMRPTFAAYGDIEARIGPLRGVYTSVATGTATLEQMAIIVFVGMSQVDDQRRDERTGADITIEAIAERIYENGPWSEESIEPVVEYLASLGWTPDQRKKIAADLKAMDETIQQSA